MEGFKFPEHWEQNRRGMLNFLAELRALYPNEPIYFLARDGEYLYDMARVLFADDAKALSQLKLINVSTYLSTSPMLEQYLAQEGISRETLKSKRIVLVDTGFAGSIPDRIKEIIGPPGWDNISTHLVVSVNPRYPSSRAFLQHIDPRTARRDPQSFRTLISDYEELPHFTETGTKYAVVDGRIVPMSAGQDPEIRSRALALMTDLKDWTKRPETKALFNRLHRDMRLLVEIGDGTSRLNKAEIKAVIRRLTEVKAELFTVDYADAVQTRQLTADGEAIATIKALDPENAKLKNSLDEVLDIAGGKRKDMKVNLTNIEDAVAYFSDHPEKFAELDREQRSRFIVLVKEHGNSRTFTNLSMLAEKAGDIGDLLDIAIIALERNESAFEVRQAVGDFTKLGPDKISRANSKSIGKLMTLMNKNIDKYPDEVLTYHYLRVSSASAGNAKTYHPALIKWLASEDSDRVYAVLLHLEQKPEFLAKSPWKSEIAKALQTIAVKGTPLNRVLAFEALLGLGNVAGDFTKFLDPQWAKAMLGDKGSRPMLTNILLKYEGAQRDRLIEVFGDEKFELLLNDISASADKKSFYGFAINAVRDPKSKFAQLVFKVHDWESVTLDQHFKRGKTLLDETWEAIYEALPVQKRPAFLAKTIDFISARDSLGPDDLIKITTRGLSDDLKNADTYAQLVETHLPRAESNLNPYDKWHKLLIDIYRSKKIEAAFKQLPQSILRDPCENPFTKYVAVLEAVAKLARSDKLMMFGITASGAAAHGFFNTNAAKRCQKAGGIFSYTEENCVCAATALALRPKQRSCGAMR